jgi:hypothetical protein
MSDQIEIPIPEQPVESAKFKRRDVVWFINHLAGKAHPNKLVSRVTVIEHYEFARTYRVQDAQGERLVKEIELYADNDLAAKIAEYERERDAEKLLNERIALSQVILAWKGGMKTPEEMVKKFGGPKVKYINQIKAAKKRGFIS